MLYKEGTVPKKEENRRTHHSEPYYAPTHAGGNTITLLHRSSATMWQLCACYHFNYSNEILICLSGIVNYYNLYFRFI